MRSIPRSGFLVIALSLAAAALPAQNTYDIADYFLLTPGKWMIRESHDIGVPTPVWREGMVVTQLGQFTLQNGFEWNGKTWLPKEIEIFEVTATHLVYHGTFDPVTQDYTLLSPPLRAPRQMKVNSPFTYVGSIVTPAGSAPFVITIVITADKLTHKTRAGTFTNCLRLKVVTVTDTNTDTSSEIRAPKEGRVYGVEVGVDETEPEASMVDAGIYERVQPTFP